MRVGTLGTLATLARVSTALNRRTFAMAAANPVARFKTTKGVFDVELYMDKLPITCSNFVDLSKTGFYDGLSFHRVIKGFMCQFGCPNSKDPSSSRAGTGGPPGNSKYELPDGSTITRDAGGNIPDELLAPITNAPGTVSMANTGAPNSGGSQIFINTAKNNFLDYFDERTPSKHPVFGAIVEGMDVVKAIESSKTNSQDKPVEPIFVETIEIIQE